MSMFVRNTCCGIALLSCSFMTLADENMATILVDSETPRYLSKALDLVTANSTAILQTNEDTMVTDVSMTNIAVDDSRIGWQLNIGFGVTDNVAIEAGYMDLDEGNAQLNGLVKDSELFFSSAKKIHFNAAEGFTLGSVYRYNISSNIDLTGSIGLFNWEGGDLQLQSLNSNQKITTDDSGTDVYFGLGGGYQLADDVTLMIEWERYKYNDDENEMWSIGVNYHFK